MKHRGSILAALALALVLAFAGAWAPTRAYAAGPLDTFHGDGDSDNPGGTFDARVSLVWVGPEAGPVQVEIVANSEEHGYTDNGLTLLLGGETWVDRTVGLSASNGWSVDVTLPEKKAYPYAFWGMQRTDYCQVRYTLRVPSVEGYVPSVTYGVDSATVTYTATGTVSVPVTVVWDDGGDADGIRPASVSWQLLADGAPSGAAAEAAAAGGWAHTWDSLPIVVAGRAVSYTLADPEAPEGYTVSVSGDAASGYTVTYTHRPSAGGNEEPSDPSGEKPAGTKPVGEKPADEKPAGKKAAEKAAAKPAGKRAGSKAARLPRTGDAAALALTAAVAAPAALGAAAAIRRRRR